MSKWELVREQEDQVRRMAVPGGWLYQVQNLRTYTGHPSNGNWEPTWHPPYFVSAINGGLDKDDADVAHDGDDPLRDTLVRALEGRTGKLGVADAFLLCGLEAGKVNQDQLGRFSRAIRELGWERKRRRAGGSLEYVYVKGTEDERAVALTVEYDRAMRSVRISTATEGTKS